MMNDVRGRDRQRRVDVGLLIAVYALSLFGILCISMATYDMDVSEGQPLLNKILNSRSSMWQSIFVLVSPVVIGTVIAIPNHNYKSRAWLIYFGVLGLLLITLVAGQVSNGLKGWLKSSILGRSIQPCEFAKLSVMLILAKLLSEAEKPMGTFREFARTLAVVGIPSVVVLLQGETGSVIVILFMFMVMIFFAGVDKRILIGIIAVGALGIGFIVAYGLMAENTDYRILRLLAFLDPQKYSSSGGYQIIMSQTAIGAGQQKGVGMFVPGSWTTLGFVPESSTDSVFSVVGECFGFTGCCAVLAAYLFIVLRMLYLARYNQDKFGQLVIIGVMAMLFFHVFQNVAMSIGFMPITGIPLPFLSYGGSNYITNIAGVALVLSMIRERPVSAVKPLPLPTITPSK